MLSPKEKQVIEESVKLFEMNLHSVLPLRHMSEHNDEVRIRNVADKEARKCRSYFMEQLNEASEISLERTGALVEEFCSQLQQRIHAYVIVNKKSKEQSVSCLKQRVDRLYLDIQLALEEKLILDPDMGIQTIEDLCKSQMQSAMSYFEIWKHGNLDTYENQKRKLEEKLNGLKAELVEKKRRHLNPTTESEERSTQPEVQLLSPLRDCENDRELHPVLGAENSTSASLHKPDERGYVPLLRSICDGRSPMLIQKMLDVGANPNAKTTDGHAFTAAHLVILSLFGKRIQPRVALSILDLLIARGFNLINTKSSGGFTALCLAMEYQGLNDEIILWFHLNGADFNAVDDIFRSSILFHAVFCHQPVRLLRMLMNCGANANITNRFGDTIQHMSSVAGHDAALEFFIDQRNVNGVNEENETSLSLLFAQKDFEYERSLLVLLRNGVDFRCRCKRGCHNVLKHWLFYGEVNPFPALWKAKCLLPITEEMASEIFTFFIKEIQFLQKFMLAYPRREIEDCANFLVYIVENKHGNLLFSKEAKLEEESRRDIEKVILNGKFRLKLKSTRFSQWKGQSFSLHAVTATNCEFRTEDGIVSYSTADVLSCQLACKNYQQFVKFALVLAKEASKYPVNTMEKNSAKSTCLVQ